MGTQPSARIWAAAQQFGFGAQHYYFILNTYFNTLCFKMAVRVAPGSGAPHAIT